MAEIQVLRSSVLAAVAAVLVVGSARAAPSEPRCAITGDHVTLSGLIVHTRAGSFEVAITDAPVQAVAHGDTVDVEVHAALAFKAVVKRKIWYSVKNGIFAEGVVMADGAHLIGTRAVGYEVIGDAVLDGNDVLAGEDKEADMAVAAVHVPCSELSLDWSGSTTPVVVSDGTRWFTHGTSLALHSEPDDHAPAVRVTGRYCDGCVDAEGLARRDGWRKIAVSGYGVVAAGWVRTRWLEQIPDSEGSGRGVYCTGLHGSALVGDSVTSPGRAKKRSARIKAGTPIYDRAGEPWATVSREQVFQVMYAEGESSAAVVDIPGVTPAPGVEVYVQTSALIFES